MGEFPSFELFFSALRCGAEPFPWQKRLANIVVEQGWPNEIGVPTGLGKTACIDIAVWSLANQGLKEHRVLPTRTWYVVNRRLLVDTAYEYGERLARLLEDPDQLKKEWPEAATEHVEALRAVGSALGKLPGVGNKPLHITRLRGGADLGARVPFPSQPSLIFSTIPMFASRWLFRGYGSSTGMRPIDAALAGTDSLVLLDEAHLAQQLIELREPLGLCDVGSFEEFLSSERCRPVFVGMTATGTAAPQFTLDEDDRDDSVIKKRLSANKPSELHETTKAKISKDMAAKADELMQAVGRSSCVVFVNTPWRAREVWEKLYELVNKHGSGLDRVLLVTGRMRDREADAVRKELLDPVKGAPAGKKDQTEVNQGRLWVVATQTLEVGADLDFDALVTETAGVRSLIQRLGRCNRLGEHSHARVAVFHATDLDQPIYGDEPKRVWENLKAAAEQGDVLLGPEESAQVLGEPQDDLSVRYEILPSLVWEWAKTSCSPRNEAPVEAFFAPSETDYGRISVCWRAYRPQKDIPLVPSVSGSETIDVPVGELKNYLLGKDKSISSVCRLAADRVLLEECPVADLRPGDIVVLHTTDGGYDKYGWNPVATEEVLDVSLLKSNVLPLTSDVIKNLASSEELELLIERVDDDGFPDAEFDFIAWVEEFRNALSSATRNPLVTDDEWNEFVKLGYQSIERADGVSLLVAKSKSRFQAPIVQIDALEQLSFDAKSVELYEHLGSVGDISRDIGRALGLNDNLVDALYQAGRWHDLGKADQRFQQWLNPLGDHKVLLAKSRQNRYHGEVELTRSNWPRGGRHEALSGQMVQALLDAKDDWSFDKDLVVHLVLSHHGHGRPLVPGVEDYGGQVTFQMDGTEHTLKVNLSSIDWDQPARFRRLCERYGYWGLALLEAIVRQADHVASGAVVA